MRADRKDPVIAKLRRLKPAKFEVTLRDGTKKNVPLSSKQNRWEQLLDTLDAMQWVAIEAQDADGQVLGACEREGDWEDEIELDGDIERGQAFAKIILNAVATAMSETRKMFDAQMRAQTELTRAMLDSQHVLVESYSLALKVQATSMGQMPEGPEQDKVMQMLQMAMAIKSGGSPAITITPPPPKPNGVAKTTGK